MKHNRSKDDSGAVFNIGCLVFEKMDQIDFTGPFEVLSRMPNVKIHVIGKTNAPVKDLHGLIITPTTSIDEVVELDLLHVPGGIGQIDLKTDETILSFIRTHFHSGKYLFAVCTGTLLCGAAGILDGVEATTHWAAWDLLSSYGAIPVKKRVVQDGKFISAAGVTAGIDGALEVARILFGEFIAKSIQLQIEYAPEPPFNSGTPELASPDVLKAYLEQYSAVRAVREADAKEYQIKKMLRNSAK